MYLGALFIPHHEIPSPPFFLPPLLSSGSILRADQLKRVMWGCCWIVLFNWNACA